MRDKVEKLLKNYRAYKFAKNNYERHKSFPQAGVANYEGMPSAKGAPELFFSQVGKMADMGNKSSADIKDYLSYKRAIETIEGALETLNDDERNIIKMKWMDNLTLNQIAEFKHLTLITVRRIHRRAINQLQICFRFIEPPQIEDIPTKGSVHYHHEDKNSNRISQYINDL